MGTTVDKRVVEMQFKNDQFESGVNQTIGSLDKLKQSLDLKDSSSSLKQLGDTAKTVSLESLAASVDALQGRFSTMGIVGMTALQNITNSAINAGKQMAESLTIAPVKDGFSEYELKMGSIQTIMASTGADLKTVTGYLEELNTYSDKTIYSFSDMTSSIGKFTNSGVDLDTAVKAIQGISNEAAVSGANAQEASRAMYNFAQALSAGYVKLIDWKSIENANMATVEFKQQLIDSAVAMGTLTQQGEKYVTAKGTEITATQNFNDSLQDAWMTTEVLTGTLTKYADATTDIGKKAFAAAQDVKTFSQLMDTLKEAVGSGWAYTFEILIGDFNQAKELFTNISNVVGDMIQKSADYRNNLLEGALGSTSAIVNKSFHEAYDIALTAADGLISSNVWKKIEATGFATDNLKKSLIETAVQAGVLTEKEGKYVTATGEAYTQTQLFNKALEEGWLTSAMAVSGISNVAEEEVEAVQNIEEILEPFKKQLIEVAKAKGVLDEALSEDDAWDSLTKGGKLTSDVLDEVIDKLKNQMKQAAAEGKATISDLENATFNCGLSMAEVSEYAMQVIRGDWGNGQARVDALNTAGINWDTVQSYVDYTLKLLGDGAEASDYYWYSQLNLNEAIKDNIDFTEEQIKALEALKEGAEKAGMSLEDYIKQATRPTGRELLLESLQNIIQNLLTLGKALKDAFADIFPALGSEALYNIIDGFHDLTEYFKIGDRTAENLRRTFRGLFAVLDILLTPLKIIGTLVFDLVKFFTPAVGGATEFTGALGDALTAVDKFVQSWDIVGTVVGAVETLFAPLGAILSEIGSFLIGIVQSISDWANGNKTLTDVMDDATESMTKYGDAVQVIGAIFGSIAYVGKKIGDFAISVKNSVVAWSQTPTVAKNLKKFGDAFGKVWDSLKTINEPMKKALDEFKEKVEALGGIRLDNIGTVLSEFFRIVGGAFVGNVGAAFSNLGPAFKTMFSDIGQAISDFADKHPLFKIVWDFFKDIGEKLKSLFKANDVNAGNSLQDNLANISGAIKNFTKDSTSVGSKFGDILSTITGFLKDNLGSIMAIVGAFAAYKTLKTLGTVFDGLVDLFAGLGKVTSGIGDVLVGAAQVEKAVAYSLYMNSIKALIVSVIELAGVAAALTLTDQNKLWQSFGFMAALVGLIAGFMAASVALSKFSGGEIQTATISAMVLAFSTSLLLMARALQKIEKLQNVVADLVILGSMVTAIIVFMNSIKASGTGEALVSAGLLISFAVSIDMLISAMGKIDTRNPGKIIGQMIVIGVLIGMMIAVSKSLSLSETNIGGVLSLIAFAAAIGMLVGAMKEITDMSLTDIYVGIITLNVLIGMMNGLMVTSMNVGPNAIKAGVMLFAIGAALRLMASAIKVIASIETFALIKAMVVVELLMTFMGALMMATEKVGPNAAKAGVMLLGMSVALLILSGCVFILGNIDTKAAIQGTACLIALMVAFGVVLNMAVTVSTSAIKDLAAITACILALTVAIAVLAMIDPTRLLAATVAISALMGMFSVLMVASKFASKISKSNVIAIGVIIAEVAAIFFAFDALGVDGANTVLMATAVSEALLAVSAAIAIVAEIPASTIIAKSAELGLAVDIVVGLILGFVTAIGALYTEIEPLEGYLDKGLAILDKLFSGLASILGNAIGSFGEAMSSHLPAIGENIKTFGENIKPFFDVIGGLKDSAVDKIGIITACITGLTASDIGYGIATFLGIAPTFEQFGAQIKTFGDALVEFLKSINSMSQEDVDKVKLASEAIKNLNDAASNMPSDGGLFEMFVGHSQNINNWKSTIKAFGEGLIGFSESISSLTEEDVNKISTAANAVSALVDVSNNIPKEGGFLDNIFGTSDISSFGNKLTTFITSLKTFIAEAKGITEDDISFTSKVINDLINPLITSQNSINADKGILQAVVGYTNFEKFGENLTKLGEGITSFMASVDGLTEEDLTFVGTFLDKCLNPLISSQKDLNATGGFWQALTGEQSLGNFAGNMALLGAGIASFKESIGEFSIVDKLRFEYAAQAVQALVTLAGSFDGSNVSIDDQTLLAFSGQFEAFGSNIAALADKIKGITNWGSLQNLGTTLGYFTNSKEGIDAFVDGFGNLETSDLNTKMTELGTALASFSNLAVDVKLYRIIQSKNIVTNIGDLITEASALKLEDTSELEAVGEDINAFAEQLKTFLEKAKNILKDETAVTSVSTCLTELTALCRDLAGVSSNELTTVVTNLDTIVGLVDRMGGDDKSGNVQAFCDSLGTLSGDIIQNFIDAFGEGTDGAVEAVQGMSDGLVGVFSEDELARYKACGESLVSSVVEGIKASDAYAATLLIDKIYDALDAYLDIEMNASKFKRIGTRIDTYISNGLGVDDTSSTTSLISELITGMTDLTTALNGIDAVKFNTIVEALKSLADTLRWFNSLNTEGNNLSDFFSSLSSDLDGSLESVVNSFSTRSGSMKDAVDAFFQPIKDLNGADSASDTSFQAAGQHVVDQFKLGMDGVDLTPTTDTIKTTITTALSGASAESEFKTVGETVAGFVSDGVTGSLTSIGTDFASKAAESVKTGFQTGVLEVVGDGGMLQVMLEEITTVISNSQARSDVWQAGCDFAKEFGDGLSQQDLSESVNTMIGVVSTSLDLLNSPLKTTGNPFFDKGAAIATSISDGIKEASPTIRSDISALIAEDVAGAVDDGLSTSFDGGLKAVNDFLDTCGEKFNGSHEAFKSHGWLLADYLINGFNKRDISSGVAYACSSLEGTIRSYYYKVRDAGFYLAEGLANGISNGTSLVASAAQDITQKALDKIKKTADEASPSKKTRLYGKYISEGLALGITDYGNKVSDASAEVTEGALENMANVSDSIADSLGNNTVATIAPVIDLTNVQNGVKTLDGMLDNTKAVAVSVSESFESNMEATNNELRNLATIGQSILNSINNGGDIYLNENLIIGRINRRLGML